MKDFKDMMEQAQQNASSQNTGKFQVKDHKLMVAVVAVVLALFLVGMIIAVVVANGLLGAVSEDDGSLQTTSVDNVYAGGNNYSGYSGNYDNTTSTTNSSTTADITNDYGSGSTFQFGTVAGTTYESAFSGVSFQAPAGWTLTGYNSSSSSSVIQDLDAVDAASTNMVSIVYYALQNNSSYNSADAVLTALKSTCSKDGEIVSDSVKLRIGGNTFTGFIYRTNAGAYSEIVAAEVNGYACIIQISSQNTTDLTTVLGMFS